MENDLIYLDTYILQQDMRIRMPKSILTNLNIEKGKTHLDVYKRQNQYIVKNQHKVKNRTGGGSLSTP